MSCEIDAESLRRISRMVADPCDIMSMRAVCRDWRSIIVRPFIPRMAPHDAWKWASKFGFETMKIKTCTFGGRDLQKRVLPRVTPGKCWYMWSKTFARLPECQYRSITASLRGEYEAQLIRAIAHGFTDVDLYCASGDVLETLGKFADDEYLRAIAAKISGTKRNDIINYIICGAIDMHRGELVRDLIEILTADGSNVENYIGMRLLSNGYVRFYSAIRRYMPFAGRIKLIESIAESGDRDAFACIYRDPDKTFDFDRMIRGAARAPSDISCKLARAWLTECIRDGSRVEVPTLDSNLTRIVTSEAIAGFAGFACDEILIALLRARDFAALQGYGIVFAYLNEWYNDIIETRYSGLLFKLKAFPQSILRDAIVGNRYWIVDIICRRHTSLISRDDIAFAREHCQMCYEVMLRAMTPGL